MTWDYKHLVSGASIGMVMPQKLQPGHLRERSLTLHRCRCCSSWVAMLVIGVMKQIDIHPMHFAFISAAFFAFHLLLAYLADQLRIHLGVRAICRRVGVSGGELLALDLSAIALPSATRAWRKSCIWFCFPLPSSSKGRPD